MADAKIFLTFEEMDERLCDLDTEYRESLAKAMMEFKYVSDTPLRLSLGTEKQYDELMKAMNKHLKPKEIRKVVAFMEKDMRGDFQYGRFASIANEFLSIADMIEKDNKRKKER